MSHHGHSGTPSPKKIALLALGALGVVYGDIGTSPLYAVKEIFFGHAFHHFTNTDVLQVISLLLWSLIIIVSLKYVLVVLRADNEGEGGVFALYSLIEQAGKKKYAWALFMLTFAAGLLFGDGMITPAISVVSAVEGLGVMTSSLKPFIVPITVAILTGLFMIQSKGTEKVGRLFGPVMIVWFSTLAVLGASHLVQNWGILAALNPMHAIAFFMTHPLHQSLVVMGSVMLVITGGEALYADMGHFGSLPIRISWYSFAFPSLILQYLGQGAYLLNGNHPTGGNIFFSMAPAWGLVPLILLATMATVIASQAMISGAFSLITQAVSLGLLPFADIDHTSDEQKGQIYISIVNWALYFGSVSLVLIFQSSTNLAGMYGMAVAGDMLINTICMIIVATAVWKWRWVGALALFVPIMIIDLTFFSANLLKFAQGGYIPATIGLIILFVSKTWQWGRASIHKTFHGYPRMSVNELIGLKKKTTDALKLLDKTVIIMTPDEVSDPAAKLPPLTQVYFDRYGVIPVHMLFVTVKMKDYPHVEERFKVTNLFESNDRGTITGVTIYFGYREEPNVEEVLASMADHKDINVHDDHKKWLIRVIDERITLSHKMSTWNRVRYELFKIMQQNSITADEYFKLGVKQPLTIEALPVTIR